MCSGPGNESIHELVCAMMLDEVSLKSISNGIVPDYLGC